MEQWLRDALAEEQGYIICPLATGTYIHCDEKCEECEYYIDFKESLEKMKETWKDVKGYEGFYQVSDRR